MTVVPPIPDPSRKDTLLIKPDTLVFHDEDGNEWFYWRNPAITSDSIYRMESGCVNRLRRLSNGWALYRMNGTRVHFNSNFRADTIFDANNNSIVLSYNGSGDLSKITDTRNRFIYLSYWPTTHRLRRLYEAPDSTNGRYYEYRYGPSKFDTADANQWHYELRQVLRHYPTGGTDSLVVLDRYYYDDAYRMTTKVLPTGGYGAENDTSYWANRFRGDRVVCWYDTISGRVKFQEVVNGDGDTLLSNDQVISRSRQVFISLYPMYYPNLLDTVKIYYYDGLSVTGASHPDSNQPDTSGSYYLKVIKFKTSFTMTDKIGYKEWECTYNPATGEADTTKYFKYNSGFIPDSVRTSTGGSTTYTYLQVTETINGEQNTRHLPLPTKIKYSRDDSVLTWYSAKAGNPRYFQPDSTKDENGYLRKFYYDSNGNDTMVVDTNRVLADSTTSNPQTLRTRFGYNKGNRVRVTDPKGNNTYFNYSPYDTGAYLTRTWVDMDASGDTTPNSNDLVTKYWYNTNRGFMDSMCYYQDYTTGAGAIPIKVRYKYDPLNHLKTVTYPDSAVDSLIYDKRGNVLEKWQAKNGTNYWHTTYSYDAMDHLTQVDEQTNNLGTLGPITNFYTTKYFYNLDGNMNEFRSAHSGMTIYSTYYDYSMGRLIRVRYSDGTNDSLGYYADGSLMYRRSRKSQVTKYEYDDNCSPCGRGRLTKKRYFASADTSVAASDAVRYAYDKVGNLTKVVWTGPSALDSTLYAYDELYRLKQDSTIGLGRVIKYEYDKNGNRQRMQVLNNSNGAVRFYQSYPLWDRANRDTATAVKVGANIYTWRMQYYDTGPLKRILYPYISTALKERYFLNPRNFVTMVTDTFGASTLKFRNIYAYNPVGDRSSDSLLCTKPAGGTVQGKIRWNYDNIRRLAATRYPASIAGGDSAIYSYDAMGNRSSKTSSGYTNTYSYNLTNNQMTSEGGNAYSYDANGNLIQKSTVAEEMFDYSHDFENRLTKVKQLTTSDSVRFEYDGLGQRIRKIGLTDTTRYTWDGLYPVVEWNNQGKLKQAFIYANGLLLGLIDSTLYTNRRFFVLHDGLGSSICMANDSARIVRSLIYSDFGSPLVDTSAANTPALNRLYAGYSWDGSPANFNWMKYRQTFDPAIGRFGQEDPLLQTDISNSLSIFSSNSSRYLYLNNPHKLNCYVYSRNNPANFFDPTGQISVKNAILCPCYAVKCVIDGIKCRKEWEKKFAGWSEEKKIAFFQNLGIPNEAAFYYKYCFQLISSCMKMLEYCSQIGG